jgi:crotonobetainyl-CoA:carnitine CoA-transferase CaiB-like acyl-CoA transferase
MRARTTAEWLEMLGALDIPCGPANSLTDLLADDYLAETGFFQHMRHPTDGEVTITAFPARFSQSPSAVRRLWPALGEHTQEVLREIGCDDPGQSPSPPLAGGGKGEGA